MMQRAPNSTTGDSRPGGDSCRLAVSRYDRAAGALLALLTTVGLAVAIMAVLWSAGPPMSAVTREPKTPIPVGAGGNDQETPESSDVIEPPTLAKGETAEEPREKALDAVASILAVREVAQKVGPPSGDPDSKAEKSNPRRGGGPALIVRFPKGLGVEEYARQLDFLGIELAVWESDGLHYAHNLSKAKPDSRTDTPEDERKRKRLSLVAAANDELEKTDRELLRRAGIHSSKRVIKLLPNKWAGVLQQLLKNAAGDRKVQSIRYLVVSDGKGGYTFEVVGQPTFL